MYRRLDPFIENSPDESSHQLISPSYQLTTGSQVVHLSFYKYFLFFSYFHFSI